jgi:hypothetical protein
MSVAFMKAVAAYSGLIFRETGNTEYGVDGSVHAVVELDEGWAESGHSLDVQLKATVNWEIADEHIVYDLRAKTYNHIVFRFSQRHGTPLVLVVLCLPKDEAQWLSISCDELVLRHCCYWCQLDGPPTDNEATIRVKIPRSNVLDPDALTMLMQKVELGERLE